MPDNITPRGFVVGTSRADDEAEANLAVTALWEQYLSRRMLIDSFDFRDAVIRAVLGAFDTVNFRDWYFNQRTSPFVNDMHRRFLVDTLNFICGCEREFELITWDSLLDKQQVPTPIDKQEVSETEASFFGISTGSVVRDRIDDHVFLRDIVAKWCQRENGVVDMLYSTHILFGKPNKEPVHSQVLVIDD